MPLLLPNLCSTQIRDVSLLAMEGWNQENASASHTRRLKYCLDGIRMAPIGALSFRRRFRRRANRSAEIVGSLSAEADKSIRSR